MELSVPVGASRAMAAGMGLVGPKMAYQKRAGRPQSQLGFSHRLPSPACSMIFNKQSSQRTNWKVCSSLQAVPPLLCTESPPGRSISFKDFCVLVSTEESGVMKIRVNVSSTMTDSIFEKVFTKSLAAAQPLPGFRRMKGGKTRDIPKEVALHIIGPSKVRTETIKKIINCTIAEYVQKEGLNASKNLKVEQSYEELEAAFEPGKEFYFDAAFHLQ